VSNPSSGQTRKTVTALFCDVTGSTALGEQLDPESLREVIQGYFAEMRSVIERHGGTIEKFIGDAVMAVFGVPRVHEDDALRAVRAAADMQGSLSEANERFDRDFGVRIQVRIGVNTGEVIAGDPGAEGSSFVSGDAVNVAARLEQAAEPGEVLLGETTYRLVRAAVIAEEMPPVTAKGKSEPLRAYRLVVAEAGSQMLPRRFDVPLVGRDAELGTLLEAFEEAARGPACRIVTVIGEAGIGKSRLGHELATRIGDRAKVLRGRCLPYGEGITFFPVTEIIKEAAGIEGEAPDSVRAKIAALLPAEDAGLADRLAALLGVGAASGSIQETFLAVRRFLEKLGEETPVIAVIDDIQWAEETFLDLLQYLAGFVAGRPLLLLCLARPQLLEDRPDWGEVGRVVRLQPIDPASSEELVANLLGDAESSREIAGSIARSAAGNPLFVEEMLRMLVDDGVLTPEGSGWAVKGDVSASAAPDTVQAVIAARLDRLPPEEQKTMQYASVIGEVFWWGAVSALVEDATPVEIGRRLQALARRDLVRPDASTFFSEDAFRFGHLLIRDVAYDALPKKTRAELHERFANWVSERAAERSTEFDEIIGFHLEQAHRYLKEVAPRDEGVERLARAAVVRLGTAGRRSMTRGDMPAAINLLGRATALAEHDQSGIGLMMDFSDALTRGGRWRDAEDVLARTIEEARAAGSPVMEWRANLNAQWLRMHVSSDLNHAEALVIAGEGLRVFEAAGDDEGIGLAFGFMGDIHFWQGECGTAIDHYRRSTFHAKRGNATRLEAESYRSIALALAQSFTPCDQVIGELTSIVRETEGERVMLLKMQRFLALMHAMLGRLDTARDLARQGIETARELGLEVDLAGGNLRDAAEVEQLAGDFAQAERYLREAAEILKRVGDRGHLDSVAPDLALTILRTPGREAEALEIAAIADNALEGDADAQVRARSAKAIALARLGRVAEAEAFARDAVARAEPTEYVLLRALAHEALAQVLRLIGRAEEAEASLAKAIEAHEAKGNIVGAERDRRALIELRASAHVSE
jgi:class 3 adenylate cyclase/tetratricopeptide (TPR) repeat protein